MGIFNFFLSPNKKLLKKYTKIVKNINKLEDEYKEKSNEELKQEMLNYKLKISEQVKNLDNKYNLQNLIGENYENKLKLYKQDLQKILDKNLEKIFAIIREASDRILNMKHFDVQLIGGLSLNEGKISEMKTGEGKTLVASLPAILNSFTGKTVYVITVNDYLAKRDANILKPLYEFFDLKVGIIQEGLHPIERKEEYKKDIVYVTNSEIGFDYLKDNLAKSKEEQVLNDLFYCIIDEVDSILIDEARTPLIISGPFNDPEIKELYKKGNELAKNFEEGIDFEIDKKHRNILITDNGVLKQDELWEVENVYEEQNAILSHILSNCLKAHYIFENGKDYIVKYNPETQREEIFIIDQFTGRIGDGKKYGDGMHQALEAKEGVEITDDNRKEAEITYQMLFKLFTKLSGMTGTAQTEATEFLNIYNLEVVTIPTNKPIIRKDKPDIFFTNEKSKINAIVNKIEEIHKKGQPILVGTTSIDKSEILSKALNDKNISHTLLNAKYHEQEAEIISKAGIKGSITVATNMAGRGTDIKLDNESKELGGLYVIGMERYENRRIDDQLIGRSGRQGEPGTSQFYISLDDDLIKIFSGEKSKILDFMKKGNELIGESSHLSKIIKNAQHKIETMNFEARKHIFDYDKIIDIQRKTIYNFRQNIINNNINLLNKLEEYLKEFITLLVDKSQDYLHNESLYEEVDNFIKDLSNQENFNLKTKEVNNITTLQYFFYKDFNVFMDIEPEWTNDIIIEKVTEILNEIITNNIKGIFNNIIQEQQQNISFEQFVNEILKDMFLTIIDRKWIEHLYLLDLVREGIGLRSYNQKDPLIEFKKEAFHSFSSLLTNIKIDIGKTILKDTFVIEEQPQNNEVILEDLIGKHIDEIMNTSNNEILKETVSKEELELIEENNKSS